MQRVMLLNPKGGSGKTTIATSLAAYYAGRSLPTILFDHDAQGSSTRWLDVRPTAAPGIDGVAAFRSASGVTRSWQMRVPPGVERVIVDTPAGVRGPDVADLLRRADRIVIPVLPSHIDIDAVAAFVVDLAALEPVRSGRVPVAVVANRVREKTLIFSELERFLLRLEFPFVACLRESQNYVRAAERGLGVHEMNRGHTRIDRRQWTPLLGWIEAGTPGFVDEAEGDPRPDAVRNYTLPV